jgi:hypothetical protein
MTNDKGTPVADRDVFSRALGIITSPGATYRSVIAYPRPAAILLVVCVVTGLATAIPQFTERGRQAALDLQVQQAERFSRQPVPPQAYEEMERLSRYGGWFSLGTMFFALPALSVVTALVYWVVFNTILGGTASFKQVVAIVTHALVIFALGAVVAAPIQHVQGTISPAGPFNLHALAPMLESGTFAADLLASMNVFAVWQLIVTAIGLGLLYQRRTTGIAIGLLAAYVLLMAAVAGSLSLLQR